MISIVALCFLLALVSKVSGQYTSQALADQISNLPGTEQLTITFNQFSGYLDIPGGNGNSKHMHYWFVESMKDPANDPLTFWTNGGPGCSGLIGFMTEQGAFKPNADGTLSLNDYAWNKVSNMVFIESPAGVGFSYSDDRNVDYKTGDTQTAIDNYNLIQAFLVRFPQYSNNSLYITSESYGGHYIPTLAKQIVTMNDAGNNPHLNFKGLAVGNPYIDPYSGTGAEFDTYWGHQLISKLTYDSYTATCVNGNPNSAQCLAAVVEIESAVSNLNPYALDYPICVTGTTQQKSGRAQQIWFKNAVHADKSAKDKALLGIPSTEAYDPCLDNYANTYLNRVEVKRALHVLESITWGECSNSVSYNSTDSTVVSTAPIFKFLIDGGYGLNILVYSGDDDAVCATIGTQAWIWNLGYSVSGKSWNTYLYNQQTAGFLTKWSKTKLGFLTIHGAGHEGMLYISVILFCSYVDFLVPTYKPDVALDMFTRYLNGEFTNA